MTPETFEIVKLIAGPTVTAITAIIIGAFTLRYQAKQSDIAERKLFADIFDRRYKAIINYTEAMSAEINRVLGSQEPNKLRQFDKEHIAKWKAIHSMKDEIAWLFDGDVIRYSEAMVHHGELVMASAYRLLYKLAKDNPVFLTDTINYESENFYNALGQLNEAARPYLFMGDTRKGVRRAKVYSSKDFARQRSYTTWKGPKGDIGDSNHEPVSQLPQQ